MARSRWRVWRSKTRDSLHGPWSAKALRRLSRLLCVPKTLIRVADVMESPKLTERSGSCGSFVAVLASTFKSKIRLEAGQATWTSKSGDGGPFCGTTRQTLPPWICSWFRPLAANYCTASCFYGLIAEISSGSTSQQIRRRSGSDARSPRLFLRCPGLHDP